MKSKIIPLSISTFLIAGFYSIFLSPAYSVIAENGTPNEATLDFFNINGIYYYNPNGGCIDKPGDSSSAGVISGKDNATKAWNYFVTANIDGISNNPAAIAGILGNLQAESTYNPYSHRDGSSYYGIYQSDSTSMISKVTKDAGDYWGKSGKDVPDNANDEAMKIELDYLVSDKLWSEKRWTNYVDAVKNVKDPGIAAELFMVTIERCVGSSNGNGAVLTSNEAKEQARKQYGSGSEHIEGLWQATDKRRSYAEAVYKEFAKEDSTSTDDSSNTSNTSDGSNVTIIGDSITKASEEAIKKLLPEVDINAKVGRQFSKTYNDSGTEVLEKIIKDNKLRSTLVFALGTNDANLKEKQVKEVVKLAEDNNTHLIFITNYDSKNENKYAKNNALFNSFAKDNSNVTIIDWASTVSADPSKYISSDGIHPTKDGEELFAELISDTITILNNASTSTSDNICTTVDSNSQYTGDGIPSYAQCDPKWGNLMYGIDGIHGNSGTTICESGCGPTSFAMMATVLLDKNIFPDEVADYAGKQGMHVLGAGSSHQITKVLAAKYNLDYEPLNTCNVDTINEYLRDGWMIHTVGRDPQKTGAANSNPFWGSGGHYIGITGVSSDGKWFVADSSKKGNQSYDPNVVTPHMTCSVVEAIKNK